MKQRRVRRSIRRVDIQVSILTAIMVVISCFCIFAFHYRLTYNNMIDGLTNRVSSIHDYAETFIYAETFTKLSTPEDMNTPLYEDIHNKLYDIKQATGVQYLYTATLSPEGTYVYVVDGLGLDAQDFRYPGDPIEADIIPEIQRAMAGEKVLPDAIKNTEWGKIFIAYLPIHDEARVVGVIGIEFEAGAEYHTYRSLRIITPVIAILACLIAALLSFFFFRRISNPTFRDLANTDHLTQLKNRNAFETDMKNLEGQRKQAGLGVILMDLNNLKAVNDTLGHEAGDLYLQTAANAIREGAPERMAAYRVGGDEFVLLLPATDHEQLQDQIQRIKASFALLSPQGWSVDLSLSAGHALFDVTQDANLFDTYRRADSSMYGEKQQYHQDDETAAP